METVDKRAVVDCKPGIWVTFAVLVGVLLVSGVAAISASMIPFEILLAKVRSLSASGVGSFFGHDFYHAMQVRLRLIGGANMIAATILFLLRSWIVQWGERVATDFSVLYRDFRTNAKSVGFANWIMLAGLVLFAGILRVSYLSHLSQLMRYDEAYTFVQYSSRPFYAALSFYNFPNNHLFHTLLVRISYLLFGSEPWALRIPALVAGLLLVPATYAAARSLFRGGAMLAAGLVAASAILIDYSTNARGYTILCLFFILLIAIVAYAARHDNWGAWLLAGIVSAVGFYTIPIMLYPFGGILTWLVLSAMVGDLRLKVPTVLRRISVVAGIAGLLTFELYSPVFAVSGPRAVFFNQWVVPIPIRVFLRHLAPSLASTWHDWTGDLPLGLSWLLVAGFVICLFFNRRCSYFRIPLALAMIAWIVPVVAAQRVVPFERVWLFALPLFFMTAAAGLEFVAEPLFERFRWRSGMTLIALAISFYAGVRTEHRMSVALSNHRDGLSALASFLKGLLQPGDSLIAATPSDAPILYYFYRLGVPYSYVNSLGPGNMYLVVNRSEGDTLKSILEEKHLPPQLAQSAKLISQFESTLLYEIVPPSHTSGTDRKTARQVLRRSSTGPGLTS
jgi:hypothetical protein